MYVVTVRFTIGPQHVRAFIPLVLENARTSRNTETGCRQFDVCHNAARPESVFLYEVYDSPSAFEDHLGTAHFKSFDEATRGMVTAKQVFAYERLNQ